MQGGPVKIKPKGGKVMWQHIMNQALAGRQLEMVFLVIFIWPLIGCLVACCWWWAGGFKEAGYRLSRFLLMGIICGPITILFILGYMFLSMLPEYE